MSKMFMKATIFQGLDKLYKILIQILLQILLICMQKKYSDGSAIYSTLYIFQPSLCKVCLVSAARLDFMSYGSFSTWKAVVLFVSFLEKNHSVPSAFLTLFDIYNLSYALRINLALLGNLLF